MRNSFENLFAGVLSFFLYFYERFLMFRVKRAWGIANLRKIKNKGTNVKAMGYTRFLNPESIVLGDNVRIGYDCFLYGKGGIEIKSNTILSRRITIYSSNHDYLGDMIPYSNEYTHGKVTIGTGVWIGMGVSITPGVTIGDGAIIGMGTIISKDVKAGEIVVGKGQRAVGMRDMKRFEELANQDLFYSKKYPNN